MAIVIHKIHGNLYAYRHYRQGNKVISDYIGPVSDGATNKNYDIRSPAKKGTVIKRPINDNQKTFDSFKPEVPVKKESITKEPSYKYTGFTIEGDTYTSRREIKAMGGKWNNDMKAWIVPATSANAKKINELKKNKKISVSAYKSNEDPYKRLTEAERLDIRSEKFDKKVERYESKASKYSASSDERLDKAHQMASIIPMGQPILVGHYSEGRDRRYRDKIDNNMRKGIEEGKIAAESARKAESAERYNEFYTKDANVLKGRVNKAEADIKKMEKDKKYARSENELKSIEKQIQNRKDDIKSLKERIPEDKKGSASGITMSDIAGPKLKKVTGAETVTKSYHNKNLKGGNFGIIIRKNGKLYTLNGEHNSDGVVTAIRFDKGYFGQDGSYGSVVNKDNYQSMTQTEIHDIIKKGVV